MQSQISPEALAKIESDYDRFQAARRMRLEALGLCEQSRLALDHIEGTVTEDGMFRWRHPAGWRIITSVELEALGWRISAARSSHHADLPQALLAAAAVLDRWTTSVKHRAWVPAPKCGDFEVSLSGEILEDGQPCPWQLDDIEDRSEMAALSENWTEYDLCQAALDGCAQAVSRIMPLVKEGNYAA